MLGHLYGYFCIVGYVKFGIIEFVEILNVQQEMIPLKDYIKLKNLIRKVLKQAIIFIELIIILILSYLF